MGYDQSARRKIYELRFRPYPGLVVRCRKPGFDALDKLTHAVLRLGDDLTGDGLAGERRLKLWRRLFEAFSTSLVSWNLTVDGRSVPAKRRGVLAQDHGFLLAVVRTWYEVVVQADETPAPVAPKQPAEPQHGDDEDDLSEAWLATVPGVVDGSPDDAAAA